MYVPRAVFMFISGKKGEIACTLPEWIHSATHTTRKGIQNDRFSDPPDGLLSKALSQETIAVKGQGSKIDEDLGFCFSSKQEETKHNSL